MCDERSSLTPNGPSINTAPVTDDSVTIVQQSSRHALPWYQRLGYSVGHVQNDLCSAMWFSYLLVFMVSVLQFTHQSAGVLLLIGQVADAMSTPIVGIECDRSLDWVICKYGRRKTWHLLGTVCVLLSFPLIFNICIGCSNSHDYAKMIYYSSFIIIFQFGWASVQISHLSLIPDLTPISCERIELNAFRYAFTVASNIFVYAITWFLLRANFSKSFDITNQSPASSQSTIGPDNLNDFRNTALVVIVVGGIFSILFHLLVRERKVQSNHTINSSIEDGITNIDYSCPSNHLKWRHWFRVPQFYKIGILYMATRLTINLTQVYTPFYLQYNLFLNKESIAYIPLVMYLSGFKSSFFIKFLNQKAGRKMTYLIGCLLSLAAFSWIYLGHGATFKQYEIYGVAVLIGLSGTTMLITSLGITNDLIGHNTSSGAFVFGAMSFLDKLSNGIAVMLIQLHHPCSKQTCAGCCDYYRQVLTFVCGGSTVLGILMLITLIPNKIGEISASASSAQNNRNNSNRKLCAAKEANGEECSCSDSDSAPLLRPSDKSD
ncbi:major facilitator superfamily domain-containing protein 12-like protein [Dinothrombium tinctorium]|uniref:Major facilitator superfamily domain-containing protein 12-like protein n=1 Tax=Dinothrombium tinctorium TaxID=1965070 RepID=A0A3S3P4V5_9ACAR|nr:major facilitator superfamily domain-containing protein 12-like protein [Dinothrombium tinctorium]RWS12541.1 major facilitator superfamily domain-containing protein 12-like protein [Dinothrombium tinctorium]RWS12592.1 major facilitator superfamily domain-containing protein 12-like protein [Dinothrombium tinctorium]